VDVRKKHINLVNTLTRREEAYHRYVIQKQIGEEGLKTLEETLKARDSDLEQYLVKDWYTRTMFRDHFFHPDTTIWGVARANYGEQGDFTIMPFSVKSLDEKTCSVELFRDGHVWIGPEWHPVKLVKKITVEGENTLGVNYIIKNLGSAADFWFGTDLAYYVWPTKENGCIVNGVKNEITSFGEDNNVREFMIVDKNRVNISVYSSKPAMLYRFPIYTVSRSEGGLEKTYQHYTVIPSWKMRLEAGEEWSVSITQKIY
ncbi:MAG: alpha-amylase/4-alpha-glucanotransferase domain-containing protein, partial [Candidatus Korarchaeota archaeon]